MMKEKLANFGILIVSALRVLRRFKFVHDKSHREGTIRLAHDTNQNLLFADFDMILRQDTFAAFYGVMVLFDVILIDASKITGLVISE